MLSRTIANEIRYNQGTLIQYLNILLNTQRAIVADEEFCLTTDQLNYLSQLKDLIINSESGSQFKNNYKAWKPKLSSSYISSVSPKFYFFTQTHDLSDFRFLTLIGTIENNFENIRLYPQLFLEKLPPIFNDNYTINTDNAIKIYDIANQMALSFSQATADDVSLVLTDVFTLVLRQIDLTKPKIYNDIINSLKTWQVRFINNENELQEYNKHVIDYISFVKKYLLENNDKEKSRLNIIIQSYLLFFKKQFNNNDDMQRFHPENARKINNMAEYLTLLDMDLKDLQSFPYEAKKGKCAQIQSYLLHSLDDFRKLQSEMLLLNKSKENPSHNNFTGLLKYTFKF